MLKPILASSACLALMACAATASPEASGGEPMSAKHMKQGPHVVTVGSSADFDVTLAQLQGAINKRGFKTFAVVDHAKGAASIDEALNPTTLIIFGNPKGGTPFMQSAQLLGLELPLKILVHADETGAVSLSYPDMVRTIHEYGAEGQEPRARTVMGALAAITEEAGAAN